MQPSNAIDGAGDAAAGGFLASGGEGWLQVLTLGLEHETFAVETDSVHEVLDVVTITEVPNARNFVRGLINVRGKVVPVIDLRAKFGMPATDRTAESRIIVMEIEMKGQSTMVGLLADRVFEVAELAPATMEDVPQLGMRWRGEFIKAIAKRRDGFVIVMDIDSVLAAEGSPLIAAGAVRERGAP